MLADNLKRFRKQKNLTRRDLADMADLSIRTIEYIEWKKIDNPELLTLQKLAKALDITINDLIE